MITRNQKFSESSMINFVQESRKDEEAVEDLLDSAFSPSRIHLSSYSLRKGVGKIDSLCFVAKRDTGDILGVVRQWPIIIGDNPKNVGLLTGPLAVHPIFQGEGIGSSLLKLSLGRSKEKGWKRAILIGDLEYYQNFGFYLQVDVKVIFPSPTDPKRVLLLELENGSFKGLAGKVRSMA